MANNIPINLYLIPGMGTDHRVFDDYLFNEKIAKAIPIKWMPHQYSNNLSEYAKLLAKQIDSHSPFIILGVSMGGMLAMEMSQFLKPKAIILVSSAKNSDELPFKYKLGKHIPVYKMLTENMLTHIAETNRVFKDVDKKAHKSLYEDMLKKTGADFLKWQMDAIINWELKENILEIPVFHIHGNKDNILPMRNIKANKIINKGTHKMVVNRIENLTALIEEFIYDQRL